MDEACSGINSVLITLAACLFYGLWRRRSVSHILVCLANALAFVLLGNLVRITAGAWLKFRYGVDILSGTPHEVIGLVLFVSYMAMILSMDQLRVPDSPTRRRRRRPAPSVAVAGTGQPRPVMRRLAPMWVHCGGVLLCAAGGGGPGTGLEALSAFQNGDGHAKVGFAARRHVRHAGNSG